MLRRVFAIPAALSLLLCVATSWLALFWDFEVLAEGGTWQIIIAKGNAYFLGTNNTSFDQHRFSLLPWMMIFSVLPIAWVLSLIFAPKAMTGTCAICGYDLRATPDRCPECGTVTKQT